MRCNNADVTPSLPTPIYEQIGRGYGLLRQAEPSWTAIIESAMVGADSIVNVGAGTGSYEPIGRRVVAVEPSLVMIAQRRAGTAPVVRAVAEDLPFADDTFDVALAAFTVHHWSNFNRGIDEMRRVSRRQVVVTWDPEIVTQHFWLSRDYLPEAQERERGLPTARHVREALGPHAKVLDLPVPADCRDGVFAAYWARPEEYLKPEVRAAMSALALLPADVVEPAIEQLRSDLADGTWERRNGALRREPSHDFGYRVIVSP